MRTIRIYVDQPLQAPGEIRLAASAAEHLVRVLRLKAGTPVTLFNGDGHDYWGQLLTASPREVVAQLQAARLVTTESPLSLHLAQGLARGEKMDLVIQKACELGASRITPLLTERAEVKLDSARAEKRLAHWQAVAASSCEQCARARLPQIDPPQSLERWLSTLPPAEQIQRLALHPEGGVRPQALAPAPQTAVLVVGPEGGLGKRDLATLDQAGFTRLTLGPRILRTETTGLAALAALQALYGDF